VQQQLLSSDVGKVRSISELLSTNDIRPPDTKRRSESDNTALNRQHRSGSGTGFRYFTHKTIENRQSTNADAMRTKSVVYSAIVLSQFAQELAAIALEQSHVMAQPKRFVMADLSK
jgi:hypothetical protein